jgi:hypothetical protein
MGASGARAERDGVRRVLTELRTVVDGRALPDSDRKFVSIFDIVDRKVWLAVGGVFSRRHGAGRLRSKMMAFMSSKDACGRQCGKC